MKGLYILLILTACNSKVKTGHEFYTLAGEVKSIDPALAKKGNIFIFLLPDCPFSQFYSISVNQVYSVFKDRGYNFYGIVPGILYSSEEIEKFKLQYNFIPEILIDKDKKFTKDLNVNVVPKVVFMDKSSNIIYTGKIDDQAVQVGQKKYMAKNYYLLNAIKDFDSGKAVFTKSTEAVGCYIE